MCNERINGPQDLDASKACGAKIHKVHKPWHIYMFIMSIAEPGAGAYVNGCYCHADPNDGCTIGNLIYAWLCSLLAPFICGWIMSVQFGVGIYRKGEC